MSFFPTGKLEMKKNSDKTGFIKSDFTKSNQVTPKGIVKKTKKPTLL
jgi:hypothetical protein